MARNTLQKIRDKTTQNVELVPDDVIEDYIQDNTIASVLDINGAIADVFEYIASKTMEGAGEIKSFTRGPTSIVYGQTARSLAQYYRGMSTNPQGASIETGRLSRADYDEGGSPEYGTDYA